MPHRAASLVESSGAPPLVRARWALEESHGTRGHQPPALFLCEEGDAYGEAV